MTTEREIETLRAELATVKATLKNDRAQLARKLRERIASLETEACRLRVCLLEYSEDLPPGVFDEVDVLKSRLIEAYARFTDSLAAGVDDPTRGSLQREEVLRLVHKLRELTS